MLLHVSLLNILLSVLLVAFNWRTNRNTLFLGAILLIASTYILAFHLLVTGESRFWLAVVWGNLTPFYTLAAPCLYLYVRGTLEDRFHIRSTDAFHLIPFVFTLVGIMPHLLSSFEYKLEVADAIIRDLSVARHLQTNWLLSVNGNILLRPILLIGYALASIRLILRYETRLSHSRSIPQEQWKMVRNWLFTLTGTLLASNAIALGISAFYSSDPLVNRQMLNQSVLRQISGYVLALMPIALLLFPQILYGIPIYRNGMNEKNFPVKNEFIKTSTNLAGEEVARSSNPNYSLGEKPVEDPFTDLGRRIIEVMEQEKPYINPDFSLDMLSEIMDTPKHHLYYCFRNILNMKFTQLRMDYRIEHAKKLLTTVDLNTVTLESVGKDSGFASKSGFYNTFKAEVGCSPGEFAEQHNMLSAENDMPGE